MAKYIDADALMKNFCGYDLTNCQKYGNETTEQRDISYSTMMMYEIADEIENMPAADVGPARRWISVDERLPEYEGSYLVCTAKSDAFISHYYPQHKHFNGANGHITHWMNRPEPPKMDGGSK